MIIILHISKVMSTGAQTVQENFVIEARHRLQGHAKTYVETLEAYTTYMVSICPGSVNGDTVRSWRASMDIEIIYSYCTSAKNGTSYFCKK